MQNTDAATFIDTRIIRRLATKYLKKVKRLLLRYIDDPELVREMRSELGITTYQGLTEEEMQNYEILLGKIKNKNEDSIQEKDLVVIEAINSQIGEKIRELLEENEINIREDGKFSSLSEAAKTYSEYKKIIKSTPISKSLILALDLLVLSYVSSGAISSASSVERLTRTWPTALWLVLSTASCLLGGFSSKVFASKFLDKVTENPQPNILFAALATPTALAPSIPILNASDIIPYAFLRYYFAFMTYITLLSIFTEDFVTSQKRISQGFGYLKNNGLSCKIFDDTAEYMEQTRIGLAIGLIGRSLMFILAVIQSCGYVSIPVNYFKIEDINLILVLMAARLPFMVTATNNSIKIIEQLYKEGFSTDSLPDAFARNFTGVLLNSAVTASIFLANSDLSKNKEKAVAIFIATIIAGSAARLKATLELTDKLSPEAQNLLQEYIQPAQECTQPEREDGYIRQFDLEAAKNDQSRRMLDPSPVSTPGSSIIDPEATQNSQSIIILGPSRVSATEISIISASPANDKNNLDPTSFITPFNPSNHSHTDIASTSALAQAAQDSLKSDSDSEDIKADSPLLLTRFQPKNRETLDRSSPLSPKKFRPTNQPTPNGSSPLTPGQKLDQAQTRK